MIYPSSQPRPNQTTERWAVIVAFAILAAVYISLTFVLNASNASCKAIPFGSFWSPDSGARFAMIQSWVRGGSLIHPSYRYADLDPSGQIHPLSYFLFHRAHDFTIMYPPVFPLLCGLSYRVFGFHGLTVIPILSGLGCIATTYKTAKLLRLRSRIVLIPVLGLSTPLLLYSVVFWDHSAIMLITSLTAYWVLRSFRSVSLASGLLAGVLLSLGIWLHEQLLALFVAAWIALLPLVKEYGRTLLGLSLGFLAGLAIWAVFNKLVYNALGGPHLSANIFQNNADHPFVLTNILNFSGLAARSMSQLVGTAIFDVPSKLWIYFLLFACSLVVYTLLSWEGGTFTKWAQIPFLLSVALAFFLVMQTRESTSPAGLFEATPLLVPALAIPWFVHRSSCPMTDTRLYCAWLCRTCWFFLLFLLINPMYPGVDWGSRYLLAALPLLVLLVFIAIERQYLELSKTLRRIALPSYAVVVGISFVCQCFGLIWIDKSIEYGKAVNAQVLKSNITTFVTNTDLGARLIYQPEQQSGFMVRSKEDAEVLSKILRCSEIDNLTFIGTSSGAEDVMIAIARSRRAFTNDELHPFLDSSIGQQEGEKLMIMHFNIASRNKPIELNKEVLRVR